MKRVALVLLLLLIAGAAVALFADRLPSRNAPLSAASRYSRSSFEIWLAEDSQRPREYAEFERFLARHGVAGVVPNWQLLRTDVNDRSGCPRPAFFMPPRDQWQHIVPSLRLLRDHLIPRIGSLEVVSAYRTEAFNECVGGASRSKHLGFRALDLVAPGSADKRQMFATLCRLQAELGPGSKFGLGAYFDPASPSRNSTGRFHVDVEGYRSWGSSQHADSSGCRTLLRAEAH
ncbi:MAG: hypothetical protein IE933_04000 [Sphingomonadales bacterium]|nr:hypothetical protein [Sphingomonadales bacterium]MBD3772543.1 hypothetical protein [Paracoccaceae bacterium]